MSGTGITGLAAAASTRVREWTEDPRLGITPGQRYSTAVALAVLIGFLTIGMPSTAPIGGDLTLPTGIEGAGLTVGGSPTSAAELPPAPGASFEVPVSDVPPPVAEPVAPPSDAPPPALSAPEPAPAPDSSPAPEPQSEPEPTTTTTTPPPVVTLPNLPVPAP